MAAATNCSRHSAPDFSRLLKLFDFPCNARLFRLAAVVGSFVWYFAGSTGTQPRLHPAGGVQLLGDDVSGTELLILLDFGSSIRRLSQQFSRFLPNLSRIVSF